MKPLQPRRQSTTLGRIVARRGCVLIVGHFGTLWHLNVSGLPLTPRDTFELRYAAGEYGQPYERLRRAAEAAGRAAMQPQAKP